MPVHKKRMPRRIGFYRSQRLPMRQGLSVLLLTRKQMNSKKRHTSRLISFANGIIVFFLLVSCSHSPPPKSIPTYPVQVGRATEKDAPIFIETLGHVASITSIDIRSRIEGELTGIFFIQGQEVKGGDLLFTIDSKPYEATLKQAKATLEESLASLALAEEKVKRYKILARDEYYSQIDYETLQANFAMAAAQVAQN